MRRYAGRGRDASLIFVGCWAIPASVDSAYLAYRSLGSLPGAFLVIMYGFFWLSLPVVLLIVGIGQLVATSAPRRWLALWVAAVLAGAALDPLGIWALVNSARWPMLTTATGYLVVGAAMTAILMAAPSATSRSPGIAQ